MQCLEQIVLTNHNAMRLAAAGKPIKAATSNVLTLASVGSGRRSAEVSEAQLFGVVHNVDRK